MSFVISSVLAGNWVGINVQGFSIDQIETERFLNLRYDGTDVAMMTKAPKGTSYEQVHHSELTLD